MKRRGIIAALAALGALAIPASASATWTTPFNVSGPGGGSPAVAIDDQGDSIIAWCRFDAGVGDTRIEARGRSAAGVFSSVQKISQFGAVCPQVATDADGDSVIAWERSVGGTTRIETRARSAAGTLGAIQTLSPPDSNAVQVAIDDQGDSIFVWQRFDGSNLRIQMRTRTAAGALSPIKTLSAAGEDANSPVVAIDPDGDAVIAWTRFDGTNDRIQARALSAAGALSPVQNLSQGGRDAESADAAMDDTGDAVFTWARFDGVGDRIQARARSSAGTFSAVQTLSGSGESSSAQVDVDESGDAVFVWNRDAGGDLRGETRGRSAAGALSSVNTFSPGDTFTPQVGVDADGDAVIAWSFFGGPDQPVRARTRSAAGTLGPVDDLSDTGSFPSDPQLDVNPAGAATVAWEAFGPGRVQAAFGP